MKPLMRLLGLLLLCSSALYAISLRYVEQYPLPKEISSLIESEPLQSESLLPPFNFEYRDANYIVQPVHRYELWGLVVSHNDISSITDAYHSSDSVDFKDLCVVWGENASPNLLERVQFWSEPWTCNFKANSRADFEQFNKDQISNNHLLAGRESIKTLLDGVRVGDQVHLSGHLVNYASEKYPSALRKTSVVRTDIGNGACEVLFVEDATILKRANTGWRAVETYSRAFSFSLLLLLPMLWIYTIQTNFQKLKKAANRKPESGKYRK